MRLADQVAIVTGGGRGIGRAICLTMAREGADVVVADVNLDNAEGVVQEVKGLGRAAIAMKVDVSNRADVDNMVASALSRFGKIDVLVNNAGITRDAMLHKMTEDQWDQVINVHLKGTFFCTQAACASMRERQSGKIVNISSVSSHGNVGQANYSAAKAGIVGLTKTSAKEFARHKIRVNCVMPGFIDTDMTKAMPEDIRQARIAEIPLGRVGQPEDIANAVLFLSSDESSYITGEVILVAGGRYI